MKFTSKMLAKFVEIGTLKRGDTFIDINNFDTETVFMVVCTTGFDCNIEFHDGSSTIAAVNLTTGELWAYSTEEEVTQVVIEDATFKPAFY